MKIIKISAVILTVLVVLLAFIYFVKKNQTIYVGGACEYQNFTDKVKVEKIVLAGDSIDVIYLNSIIDTNLTYQMDSWELSFRLGKDFSDKEIRDTINKYSITGSRITKGTCVPYSIDKMILDKK